MLFALVVLLLHTCYLLLMPTRGFGPKLTTPIGSRVKARVEPPGISFPFLLFANGDRILLVDNFKLRPMVDL